MFSGYQEREEYEDELYRVEDEEASSLSELDSELEFQLYSQLHYHTADQENKENQENQENQQDHGGSGSSHPQKEAPQPGQRKRPAAAPAPEVIVIDSGTDTIAISDATETEDSVCTAKGQKPLGSNSKLLLPSCPPQTKALWKISEEVVVVDSGSDDSLDSEVSIPPFVADLCSDSDSGSDSDGLENWMILGRGKEEGDQDIQLNLSSEVNLHGYVDDGGGPENWAVSNKDKEAQIFNKRAGLRRLSNRYYTEKTVTCHNCNKIGHLSKNCPSPKKLPCCSLCGLQGHFVKTCPNRHCSNCSLPGHTYDDCLEKAYWHKCCHRCGMIGHFFDACPDIWRQYHITTKQGIPVKPTDQKANSTSVFCYNCSRQGHFGHECVERRMFNGTYPTRPFASCYDSHWYLKRLDLRVQKQVQELQQAGLLEQQDEAVCPPQPPQPLQPAQPPQKKQKPNPENTLLPFTPTGHAPKRRIAHTPKHHPQATPKVSAQTPAKKTPAKKTTPKKTTPKKTTPKKTTPKKTPPVHQIEGKKKNKNKNKNKNKKKKVAAVNADQDFPRGPQKSPHNRAASTPLCGAKHSPAMLFVLGKGSEKSKKKKNRVKKWLRKAANDKKQQPSDENLFLIKQRKRSR